MQKNINLTLLLRFEKFENLQKFYQNNFIEFSCAANWIDYAKTNNKTGYIFECVFAHVDSEFNISQLNDSHGNAMGENLFVMIDSKDNSRYLIYEPIILSPIICFFGLSMKDLLKKDKNSKCFKLNLANYLNEFNYSPEEYGVLLIDKPIDFINEIINQLPNHIKQNNNLTSERFYCDFNPIEPIDADFVKYDKYNKSDLFFDQDCIGQEIFWKDCSYSWQNEFRIIIKNINFKQYYDPQNYDYKNNKLQISLPNLKEYSKIIPLKDIKEFVIYPCFENKRYCKYGFVKNDT